MAQNSRKPMMYLKVCAVQELKTKDTSGNTFCYIKVGKTGKTKKIKTEIVQRTSNETSWEKGRLFDLEEEVAVFQVIDYVTFFPDDFIGQVTVKFEEYSNGVPVDQWFPLQSKKGKEAGGELKLQIMKTDPEADASITDADFSYKLHTLMKKKKLDVFRTLVSSRDEINVPDNNKNTPLHVAGQLDLPECVSTLLKNGADPSIENEDGCTPVHTAAAHSPKSLSILLNEGKINANDLSRGIYRSKSASETDEKNLTPVHSAAINNQPESVEILAAKGVALNKQSDKGNTALHLALKHNSTEAVKALVTKGKAFIYLPNKEDISPAKLAVTIGGDIKNAFKEAAGVEDDREFDILKTDFNTRTRVQGEHMDFEWKKSQQFCLQVSEPTSIFALLHFIGGALVPAGKEEQFASKTGFIVIRTKEGIHQEHSYQTEFHGYGGLKPFEGELQPDVKYVVIPYSQEAVNKGKFSLLVYTKNQQQVKITPLIPWQHSAQESGEWKGETAQGCANNKEWKNNPQFTLELPKDKENVDLYIMLSQKKLEVDLIPYQVLPYPIYIGFYVYDEDFSEKLAEVDKWKNSLEVYKHLRFDTRKHSKLIIVPTTFEAGQETTFTLSVYADEKILLKKK
eukprot:TRINITY_DN135_c0_g1_i3.p1 TRINITY_DN135_c0_g1~~TRINITY_DN135_c0_g1_i3.p1  ORF type:complete len:625 (-),score=176.10 TRINITY_DN135_c0_g1_i3:208-2082(-)